MTAATGRFDSQFTVLGAAENDHVTVTIPSSYVPGVFWEPSDASGLNP